MTGYKIERCKSLIDLMKRRGGVGVTRSEMRSHLGIKSNAGLKPYLDALKQHSVITEELIRDDYNGRTKWVYTLIEQ